jgi:hypothetical protein
MSSDRSTTDAPPLSPLLLAGAGTAALGVLGLVVGGVGLAMWSSAYAAIDHPAPDADLDALYESAKLGWNLAWGGAIAGALALVAGGGLVAWSLLAPADEAAATAPGTTTETP